EDTKPLDRDRIEKNRRYNTGGPDLTKNGRQSLYSIRLRGLPNLPVEESTVILTGEVVEIQPYLSEDRGSIYTELRIKVEEFLKDTTKITRYKSDVITIDQQGGSIKLASGQVVVDPLTICNLGRPIKGNRLIIFAGDIHDGNDLQLIKAYEIRDSYVYSLSDNLS